MADGIPAKLRTAQIGPFEKRAAQLERFKPIISYWLRFYIVQKIISANLHTVDSECTAYITNLMEQLEYTKAENPSEDALLDEVAASAYCEQFALQTFNKGDRDMTANAVTKSTADTLLAASTFLEMLAIWKKDSEPEIKSKQRFAKFHAVRILKAFQNGEDPNLTNPAHEPPPAASPSALDPEDPEVQSITQGTAPPNPYQPYVETASPTLSARQVSPPPPDFSTAPTDYSAHRDVSPISQPDTSRNGSVGSVGGGYFPRVDVPTFTADTAAPSLSTAPSTEDEPMTTPFEPSFSTESQMPQALPPADLNEQFLQNLSTPQPAQQPALPPNAPLLPQHQSAFQTPQQLAPLSQQYSQNAQTQPEHQGPFKTDEQSQTDAQKHAKWAISALNFEDVNTAVKELRLALRALGA